ncbi:MAG: metal ABC transporter permease [Oscillospiraceae bacterium]|nr:metal ABC transporter permease [Oscillospiraceae bacterium]
MTEIIEKLILYFQYPFVRYALIVGILIALCSSLLGVTLVLKRFSFIGDGLSHVAFGATAIAVAMNLTNNFILVLPVTIISAILLLRTGQNTKIKGDAAIAMISVGALAVGYLIMNMFAKSANLAGDVCTTLFGAMAILTLDDGTRIWIGEYPIPMKVFMCAVLSLLVIAVFMIFYHKIFAVTFDEDFSTATGIRASVYNLMLAVIIAVVIVLAMTLVGALLISALVIFPALSAMRVFKNFKAVTICSVIVSVVCAVFGIFLSILVATPVGSTIVVVNIIGFLIFSFAGFVRRGFSG